MPIPKTLLAKKDIILKTTSKEIDSGDVIYIDLSVKINKNYSKIGTIYLSRVNENRKTFYETHCTIKDKFRNSGYGIYLYSLAADYAIKHNIVLKSSNAPNEDAFRLWKSKRLRKYYKIRFNGWRFVIKRK